MKPEKVKKSATPVRHNHESDENDLAKAIVRLPNFFERHANSILIAVIIICIGVFVVRWQWAHHATRAAASADSLAQVRQSLNTLSDLSLRELPPQQMAAARAELIQEIRVDLQTVQQDTTDRSQLAEALVARGDLNWVMANMAVLPGATTQPALQLDQTGSESLDNATKAYSQVLEKYPDQKLQAISARFGLAAIAENRHQWDAAKTQYQTIENNTAASQAFRDEATHRLAVLSTIEKPTYFAVPTSQPTASASAAPLASPSTKTPVTSP